MFLSTRSSGEIPDYWASEIGRVSIGGQRPSVELCGAQQGAEIYAPGGMVWTPKRGQGVLVMKAGAMGETPCIVGVNQETRGGLEPGELCLYTEAASVTLKNDGRIELTGRVLINGKEIGNVSQDG